MRVLVIFAFLAAVAGADKLKPEDYPPPPPPPEGAKLVATTTTTVKPQVAVTTVATPTTGKKPVNPFLSKKPSGKPVVVKSLPKKKPTLVPGAKVQQEKKLPKPVKPKKQEVRKVQQPEAERRDSSYGAPAYSAPKRQVIVKPAGPSKQYGWIGHGRYAPTHIKSPFPDDLPKWLPMVNNIFEAGLLYPGKPGGAAPSYKAPAAQESYSAPPPPPPAYEAPVASYNEPAKVENSYSAPAAPSYESVDTYNAPAPSPQPVYNPSQTSYNSGIQLPAEIPAQPAYQYNQPSYGQSSLLGTYAPSTPAYSAPAVPAYTTPPPAYSTPTSYAPPPPSIKPFVFLGGAQSTYNSPAPATYNSPAPATYSSAAPATYQQPTLPGFGGQTYNEPSVTNYEAQASYDSPKAVAPAINTFNAYDVPLKVEETYDAPAADEQDVYFIFYEDKAEDQQQYQQQPPVNQYAQPQPAVNQYAQPSLNSYASAEPPSYNQFNPPNPEAIRTIYVPYENAVNLPDVFELDVGSSFGYAENGAEPQPQQIIHGAPLPSSYDNPISSFDAPIYDENSYTASAQANYDANSFSDTLFRENAVSHVRKSRRPTVNHVDNSDQVEASGNVPFGSRLSSRTPYNILGL